jgi:hypothetical protein
MTGEIINCKGFERKCGLGVIGVIFRHLPGGTMENHKNASLIL